MSYYPYDKNRRTLRTGDFVVIDYIWDGNGVRHENVLALMVGFTHDTWYQCEIKVKFFDDYGLDHDSYKVTPYNCEWITKHRRIREQKLLLIKLENV